LVGYFALGGFKLLQRKPGPTSREANDILLSDEGPMTWQQNLTTVVIGVLIVAVAVFKVDVGMGAFIAAVVLTLCRASSEEAAVKAMPWGVLLIGSGLTVLISILEKKGGMDLFTTILARFSNERSVTGVIGFVTGLIS